MYQAKGKYLHLNSKRFGIFFFLNTVNFRDILVNMMTNQLPVKLESVYKVPYLIKYVQKLPITASDYEY